VNGLQVENSGAVRKIGAAVDASTRTFALAAESGIDLLLVHHGLFWAGLQPVTGALHRQLRELFSHNIALYGAHLPLDSHPLVGNNAQLATSLGIDNAEPFSSRKVNASACARRRASDVRSSRGGLNSRWAGRSARLLAGR
jgi:putative NIF3 family GTP cyclohydrolase 1 type 2